MTPVAIGFVAALAFLQASIAAPRQEFTNCLKQASTQAESRKLPAEQYGPFANQHCTAQADAFKSALVAFDVKNGVKRSQATSDAQLQLDDYIAMSLEKYESRTGARKPRPAPAQPVQPVRAAAPVQPQN